MFKGSRYDETEGLSTVQVAALIRMDLKRMEVPRGVKFSVRSKYYSGGSSIRITIRGYLDPIWSRAKIAFELGLGPEPENHYWMDKVAQEFLARVEKIIDRYQKDESDSQTDYFNVRFYSHVGFDNSEEDHDRQEAKLRKRGES